MSSPPDGRRTAAAAGRNRAPILSVLARVLPAEARILEVASGTGEHAVFFAEAQPGWAWHPTEPDPGRRVSVEAWRRHAGLENVAPVAALDVAASAWGDTPYDAVVAINLTHIAAWPVTEGLMRGASEVLGPAGVLVIYGPFKVGGLAKPASNRAFDEHLKLQDPAWGLRDVEAVEAAAAVHGLRPIERVPMPSHNLCLVFGRA